MAGVLTRPSAGVPEHPRVADHPRPAAVGALLAAGWAALAGALPCAAVAVVAWFVTAGGTAPDAFRVGVDAWLLAHMVPVALPGGAFSLAPLGLSLLPFVLLCRAGAWVGRTSEVRRVTQVCAGLLVLAAAYGGLAALIAILARTGDAAPDVLRAFVHAGVLAGVAGGAGVVRVSGHGVRAWRRVPEDVRAALYGGVAGISCLVAGGMLLVACSLVVHLGRLGELVAGLAPGISGLPVLLGMCLAYVPNAAVYAGTYALGPGFAVGTATVVAPTGVALGPLPAFPLLAALPVTENPPGWVMGVLVIPIAAGVVAGLAAIRCYPAYSIDAATLRGGLAGLAGGVMFTAAVAVSSGSAGPGRLAEVGPSALESGVVAVSTLGIAGAVGVLALRMWEWARARGSADLR
ncbi:DUF6350 family protein [Actinopolymorpha sp. B17G11]|uniref:cell division protein PerM n=1 Tax=unclassified Actinopolymorpha TaxID=2627063 RepID=UPI0032D8D98D